MAHSTQISDAPFKQAGLVMREAQIEELWTFPLPVLQAHLDELVARADRTLYGRVEVDQVPKLTAEINLHKVDLKLELNDSGGVGLTITAKTGSFYNSKDVGNSLRTLKDASFRIRGHLTATYNADLSASTKLKREELNRKGTHDVGYVYDIKLGNFADYEILDGFSTNGGKEVFRRFLTSMKDSNIFQALWSQMSEALHNNGPLCQVAFNHPGPGYGVVCRSNDSAPGGVRELGIDIITVPARKVTIGLDNAPSVGVLPSQVAVGLGYQLEKMPKTIASDFPTFLTPFYWVSSRKWTLESGWPFNLDRIIELAKQERSLKAFTNPLNPPVPGYEGYWAMRTNCIQLPSEGDRTEGFRDSPGQFDIKKGAYTLWGLNRGAANSAYWSSYTHFWVGNSGGCTWFQPTMENKNWLYARTLSVDILTIDRDPRLHFVVHFTQEYSQLGLDLQTKRDDPSNGSRLDYGKREFTGEEWYGVQPIYNIDGTQILVEFSELFNPQGKHMEEWGGDSEPPPGAMPWNMGGYQVPEQSQKQYTATKTPGQWGDDFNISPEHWNSFATVQQELMENFDFYRVTKYLKDCTASVNVFTLPLAKFDYELFVPTNFRGKGIETTVCAKINGVLIKDYHAPIPQLN